MNNHHRGNKVKAPAREHHTTKAKPRARPEENSESSHTRNHASRTTSGSWGEALEISHEIAVDTTQR